jgi:hypothetical protein
MLPLSGYEHTYERLPWATKGLRSDNCYAYALHSYSNYRPIKSVPGNISGMNSIFHSYTHCDGIKERILSDNPGKVYSTNASSKCRKNFYKIMMVVAPTNKYNDPTGDFHFYKQHGDVVYRVKKGDTAKKIAAFFKVPESRVLKAGPIKQGKDLFFKANFWSHKRGYGTGPLLRDACGKLITDPRKACRKYEYNYSKYCGSFCVKNSGVKAGPL